MPCRVPHAHPARQRDHPAAGLVVRYLWRFGVPCQATKKDRSRGPLRDHTEPGDGLSKNTGVSGRLTELDAEQAHLNLLYRRLDELRGQADEGLSGALRSVSSNQQDRSFRDTLTTRYHDQLAVYDAVENGLCFGRL